MSTSPREPGAADSHFGPAPLEAYSDAAANPRRQFLDQRLIHAGDRVIEELRFDARDVGEEEWSGGRRMFFDITAGFNARSQR